MEIMMVFCGFGQRKTKPNKANSVVLPPRTLRARRFLMFKNSRWCSWLGDFVSSAVLANSAVNRNLKKQSQFVPARNDANSFLKGNYGNIPASGARKNKANSKHVLSAVEWANLPGFGRKFMP